MEKVLVGRLLKASWYGHRSSNPRMCIGSMRAGGRLKGETVKLSKPIAKCPIYYL